MVKKKPKLSQLILRPSQYIRRNHLWFKDQGTYLIFSINSSITASINVSLERERLILWDLSKKWLHLIYWDRGSITITNYYYPYIFIIHEMYSNRFLLL